jgi:hypothetical protein
VGDRLRKPLWSKKGNPTRYVSDRLGIDRSELREAIHEIKRREGLGGTNRVTIYDNGDITLPVKDGATTREEPLGNIFDEI